MKRTNQLHLFDCTSLDEDSDGHVCIKCDTFKDSSEFRFRENDGTSRRSICRECTNRNGKIVQELRKYNPEMLDKDRLIAVTKSDLLDEELTRDISLELDKDLDIDYIFISSVANNGISELKDKLWNLLND